MQNQRFSHFVFLLASIAPGSEFPMAALSRHLSHEVDQKQTSDNKLLAIIAGDKSQAASRSQVLSEVFKHPTPGSAPHRDGAQS